MRIDGHFQQKLNFKGVPVIVNLGDWFWYEKKKYLITFANLPNNNDGLGALYIYCGEEIGLPGLVQLNFKRLDYTPPHIHPLVTIHNGKMYFSHWVQDPADFFIMWFDWPHGPPEFFKQEYILDMPIPDCPVCRARLKLLDL
jgi:hypothetical protein